MSIIGYPDISGHCLFCDDIRKEQGGKVSYIGCYNNALTVHTDFPVTLPKFGIRITLLQRTKFFVPDMELQIYLPGDPDGTPTFQAEFEEKEEGLAAATAEWNTVHQPEYSGTDVSFIEVTTDLLIAPITISQPGNIKVRAVRDKDIIMLGGLRILHRKFDSETDQNGKQK